MSSKIELLIEKFIGAGKNWRGEYYEIFQNPTKREMKTIADLNNGDFRFIADAKKKKLYIFSTEFHHSDAWAVIAENTGDSRRMYKTNDLFGGAFEAGQVQNWGFRDNMYKRTVLAEWVNDPDIFAFTGKWGLNVVEWIELSNNGIIKKSDRGY